MCEEEGRDLRRYWRGRGLALESEYIEGRGEGEKDVQFTSLLLLQVVQLALGVPETLSKIVSGLLIVLELDCLLVAQHADPFYLASPSI